MTKLYASLFCLFIISFANAQTGDVCTNPLTATLCNATPFSINTPAYNNDVTSWHIGSKTITAYGQDVFYQINIPGSPYQPVSLFAALAGNFINCAGNCSGKIYFLWFEKSPCTSNPTAVDSMYISGNTTLQDSIYVPYNVGSVQSQYYLVIDFDLNYQYQYTVQMGYENSQPPGQPTCTTGTAPYKGKLRPDTSKCYKKTNPYHLPLEYLHDSYLYNNTLFPLTINQFQDSLPISDDKGNGFILTIKQTDKSLVEAFMPFDSFPYKFLPPAYSLNNIYDVALTVFFKNSSGSSGLKGFRIQVPGATTPSAWGFPTGAGFYDPTGNWEINYDSKASTCTWLFNSSTGRGDNTISDYNCEVYTFTAEFGNMGDTIKAWYLPDNYGNDSVKCVYPARTDCILEPNNYENGWIELGVGGNIAGITGAPCDGGSSTCSPGIEFSSYGYSFGVGNCDYFTPYAISDCPSTLQGNDPVIQYDSTGCASEIVPVWDQINPNMNWYGLQFNANGYDTVGICLGAPYQLQFYRQPFIPVNTYLTYYTPGDNYYPVDSLGKINFNINLANKCTGIPGLPVYPKDNFSIPISTPGIYTLFFALGNQSYYCVHCDNTGWLILQADTPKGVFTPPSPDTTQCIGTFFTFNFSDPKTTFTWTSDSVLTGYDQYQNPVYYVKPYTSNTYVAYGTDARGCVDTVSYVIKVHACPPTASLYKQSTCPSLCVTVTDESPGAPTYWKWSFPGGTPSSFIGKTPPKVCYPVKGIYTISLFVSNALGADSVSDTIQVGTCGELVRMKVKDTIVCNPSCVTYYNQVVDWAYQYFWYFPGGTPATWQTAYFSYKWYDTLNVCYSDTGTYTAMVIAVDSYYGNDTSRVIIHVVNPQQPHINQNNDTLTCKPSFTTYQWYYKTELLNGATNSYYVPAQEGKYYVHTTDANGCEGVDSTVFVSTSEGKLEVGSWRLDIYPNPSDGKFEVGGLKLEVRRIEVLNTLGEKIVDVVPFTQDAGRTMHNALQIDLTNQPNGIYFIRIQTENGTVMRKLVKE